MDRWMDRQRQTDGWMDRKIMLLLHTYHTGKSCIKFGYIPPSGLGGDSMTNRWKDRGTNRGTHKIPITQVWGSEVILNTGPSSVQCEA